MLSTGSVTLSERTYKETSFTTGQLIEVTTASNQRYNEKKMNEMTSFEDLLVLCILCILLCLPHLLENANSMRTGIFVRFAHCYTPAPHNAWDKVGAQ